MIGARGKADGGEFFSGTFEGVAVACQFKRGGDVFERGHGRDQMKRLKHNAHLVAPKAGQRIFGHGRQILAQGGDMPRGGALEPAHQHQERRFARTGRPDERQRLAGVYFKRDAMENIDTTRIAIERQGHIL